MRQSTTESIDFLTEKPTTLKLQTKCGPQLKKAALIRASELNLDESKYLRRLVVKDIVENKQ